MNNMKKIYMRPEITVVKVEAEAFMAASPTEWTDGENKYPIKDEMPDE